MCDQGRCEDFAFGGGGGGQRLDLLILRRPQAAIMVGVELSRPSEIAFLESFLPKISMFYYCLTMKISKITTDQYDSVTYSLM
jgi:hypothetical protein